MDAFNDNAPFDLPPPRELADTLMARAWDDDTPDRERLLLEQGARVIEHLLARLAMVMPSQQRTAAPQSAASARCKPWRAG